MDHKFNSELPSRQLKKRKQLSFLFHYDHNLKTDQLFKRCLRDTTLTSLQLTDTWTRQKISLDAGWGSHHEEDSLLSIFSNILTADAKMSFL